MREKYYALYGLAEFTGVKLQQIRGQDPDKSNTESMSQPFILH